MRQGSRIAWLAGGAAFAIYVATLTRGVGWDDSAELAAGVANLGVVHSHGYAPYVLFGHVFTLVEPFGSDATKANLWSAVCAAGAVGLAARYVFLVSRSALGTALAALLLALGPVFWFQATVASVYPLMALAIALLLNAAHAWMDRPTAARLALLAGTIGLLPLAHWVGVPFAAGGALLIASRAREAIRGRREVLALLAVLVPFVTLVYIPLRSGYTGFPNRGGLGLWDMLVGESGTVGGDTPLTASAHGLVDHTWSLVGLLLASLSPAALVLAPLGLRALFRERPYVLCCLAPAVLDSAIVVTVRNGFAYWHVPLLVAGAITCGAGVEPLRRALRGRRAPAAALAVAIVVAPVCGALFLAHANRGASGWARGTLAALPPGARVVAPWTAYAAMRAEQQLDGLRRDVRVVVTSNGLSPDLATLRGGYAVSVAHDPPSSSGAVTIGPVAGASFKGLSGLKAGPFDIGYDSTKARTYRLPD